MLILAIILKLKFRKYTGLDANTEIKLGNELGFKYIYQ